MRTVITGAAGQVGSALVASAPPGAETVATTRSDLDLTDAASVAAFIAATNPDLIINAAAYTAVDKAESDAAMAQAVNATGVSHLAGAAREHGARLIHISTDFVFDGNSSAPYRPDDRPAPLGVYGASKLAGEAAVLGTLPDSGLVLRTAWVYAPGGRNFVLTMLRLMRERGAVSVVADQIGTPTSAESIARAIWALALEPDLHGIYHWTSSGVASWYDFAVAIAEEAQDVGLLTSPVEVTPIATEDYPTPARRPRFSVLDCRATVTALGISPPHWRASLRQVLREVRLD